MSFQFTDQEVFDWINVSIEKYKSLRKSNFDKLYINYKKNPDPLHLILKMVSLDLSHENIVKENAIIQTDKSYLNFHGKQWENLILLNPDWDEAPGTLDVARTDKSVVVELKNKHNTVKGSDQIKNYQGIKQCMDNEGYEIGLFVFMIPKNNIKIDEPFAPSNNQGPRPEPSDNIRKLDGASFFNKYIFEDPNGFTNLIDQILNVTSDISSVYINEDNKSFLEEIRTLYGI